MDNPEIIRYAEEHSSPESELLYAIHRTTYVTQAFPRMLSGHLQGRLLSMISHMLQPERILEIGTFTGYSALCLVEGMKSGGILYTIEINEELEDSLKETFRKAGLEKEIRLITGNAPEVIPELPGNFDLIFIDADKENYPAYYDLLIDRLNPKGILLADNVLWSGKVLGTSPSSDMETTGIKEFNDKVQEDPRVENLLLPFRDGLMMVRKR